MALDLSMKSSRRRLEHSLYEGYGPGCDSCHLSRDHGPVKLTKRVRFQEHGRMHVHPYGHPDVIRTRMVMRRNVIHVDSDEENRPPSSCSTSTTTTSDCESRLGTPDVQLAPHPATLEGHVTAATPASQREDKNMFFTLPCDPREWTRGDVSNWLLYMKVAHNLTEIQHDRFLMNGKALCLMNTNMFAYRVPVGGKLLYRDFRMRLSRALSTQAQSSASVSPATTSGLAVAAPTRA